MANFVVIEKDSLNKAAVNAERITLTEASIVHTKMKRDDVAEFVRDGNNLLLKLKSGEVVVIENFFVVHEDIASDLVFEEDGCVLYWFDGVSGFQNIPGLEVLLPEAGSKLGALLPWLAGAAVIGGVAAAVNNNDKKESTPSGTNTVQVKKDGTITGKTENIPDGTKVIITVTGKDKDGKLVRKEVEATVKADGSYEAKVPADLADGDLTVDSKVQDQKGNTVKAEDKLGKTDHDNNPGTPDQGGLDLEDGSITVKVDNKGNITGTTADIEPGSEVKLTITGKDKDGQALADTTVKATVNPDGSYTAQVPPNFADGDLTVKAETADRNGKPVNAEDKLGAGKTDDPATPGDESVGLDRAITVKVDNKGNISGGTADVKPGSEVKLTITGQDKDGQPLIDTTVTATVNPDGSYTAQVPAGFADGGLTVKAETADRNGKPVNAEDKLGAGKADDPGTPGNESEGLDRVDGKITVDITDKGAITGGTTDVAPNTDVVLTITGKNAAGGDVTVTKTVKTDGSGNYSSALTPADGIADGSAVTVVASTTDRNGKAVPPATDAVAGSGPDILAGDIGGLKTNFAVGHNYNISIILDRSGSMDAVMPNGQTRLEVAKKALQAFVDQMAQHDGIINLRITTFHFDAVAVIQDVVVSNGTVTSIKSEIDQIQFGGATYPETAFTDVDNWLNSKTNGYENQIYYLTDGEPNNTDLPSRDVTFANLAAKSKVFAVGVGLDVELDWVERYDNTDANGNKINNWSPTNHGEAQKIGDADKLITYLISGSENFIPADVGNDTVKGGAGDDILFGDAMNTNWITGLDPLQYPKYSGYSKLTAHLKATVTGGAEPTQQQVYDYVKANYKQFIAADAADPATKGGDDTIYGGSGDDIIIAGAGNDTVYGGSGNDVISTGRGDDTIMFDVLNAADATGGNGKDTWVDYEANDKIKFGTGFFDGLLSSDLSNAGKVGAFISVANDGLGNTVVKVDRDGAGGNHTMSDLLVLENKTGVTLQDLLNNNQIIIG